jgi:hypothetical protein
MYGIIPFMLLLSALSHAELKDLTESELSDMTAEGVGLVFESYQIEMLSDDLTNRMDGGPNGETGNEFKITGIEDTSGSAVNASISQFYFAGTGTNLGSDLTGKLVNIGRLNNPITIDLLDGNDIGDGADGWMDKSVLEIAMPTHVDSSLGYDCTDPTLGVGTGTCSSRADDADGNGFHGERFDMGYRINRQFTDSAKDVNLNFHAVSANMDGSYIRFWGGDANVDGNIDGNTTSEATLMLEAQMNFYASELVFDSCNLDGSLCGEKVGFKNFSMELALGDAAYYQPMTIDVDSNGFLNIIIQALPAPGDSRLPAGTITSDGLTALGGFDPSLYEKPQAGDPDGDLWNWYDDYYTNGRKTNISVSDLTVGSQSFGASSLQNLQIQYLEVKSHEL